MKKLLVFLIAAVIALIFLVELIPEGEAAANVDFANEVSIINMYYGINENGNWEQFADSSEIHELHKTLKNDYIRVWVSSQWYRPSTIPVHSDGSVEYTNLDRFINAALLSDAIPFVVFAHAPGTYGEAHGEPPPASDDEFADYVVMVIKHYQEQCNSAQMAAPCDTKDWYFEIWNEPFTDVWWDTPRYITMYNKVYDKIKAVEPNAKVGGYGTAFIVGEKNTRPKQFIENCEMDFISLHHYGNVINEYASEKKKMADIKKIQYDSILALRRFLTENGKSEVEIIQGEYSSDYRASYMEHLDESFTATWYASALIWQILSNEVSMELFYSGTSLHEDKGFAMWSRNLDLWPVYYMKMNFVNTNPVGSKVYSATADKCTNILAVSNANGKFITVVNKCNYDTSLRLNILNADGNLIDIQTQKQIKIKNTLAEIELDSYQVSFYRIE